MVLFLLCLVGLLAGNPSAFAQPPKADKPVSPPAAPAVIIETERGKLTVELFPDAAPRTVARFTELVQKGFYNGLPFYRVVPKFLIQAGDPKGDGTGGSGQTIPPEFNGKKHQAGTVGMAHIPRNPESADSQFYICLEPQPFLDGKYTVFGQVTEGLDILPKIKEGDAMKKVSIR